MTDSNNRLLSTLLAMQLIALGILVVMLFNAPSQHSSGKVIFGRTEKPLARESSSALTADRETVTDDLITALKLWKPEGNCGPGRSFRTTSRNAS